MQIQHYQRLKLFSKNSYSLPISTASSLMKSTPKNSLMKNASANMSGAAFSRFFKHRTGNTFIDCLTEIRPGNASRLLIHTTQSIGEIAYHCGFNNMPNFNRIFKRKKGCTPKAFRESFSGTRIFI